MKNRKSNTPHRILDDSCKIAATATRKAVGSPVAASAGVMVYYLLPLHTNP